ncbi:MAG: hypothetical protein O2975_00740, partial [Proteobacteria bacterium]|nr:hypothetical protein [Pseudomonadota bacterium]
EPEITLRLALDAAGDPDREALAALEKLFGQPPVTGAAAFERAVCACYRVGEAQIRAAKRAALRDCPIAGATLDIIPLWDTLPRACHFPRKNRGGAGRAC